MSRDERDARTEGHSTADAVAGSKYPAPSDRSTIESRIPRELRELSQWVAWRLEPRSPGEEPTKIPYRADGTDRRASSDDPATWTTFEQASALLDVELPRFDGLGFMFTDDDPFAGVDLDDCIDPVTGELHPEASRIVSSFSGAYVERSPSGTGVKLWTRAQKPEGRSRGPAPWGGEAELYDSGRYFTVTGEALGAIPDEIGDGQDALDALHAELFGVVPPGPHADRNGSDLEKRANAKYRDPGTDAELVERAKSAANGELFARLWSGDATGYGSESEADAALCSLLAFWSGPDGRERVSRLFLESGLGQREKAGRGDYVASTVALGYRDRTDYYSGPSTSSSGGLAPGESKREPVEPFAVPERGLVRDIVELIGPTTEAPSSTLVLSVLVMLSAVVGWRRDLRFGENVEPCNVHAIIAGGSAVSRKTTAAKSAERLFRDAGTELAVERVSHVSGRGLLEAIMGREAVALFAVKTPDETVERYALECQRAAALENPPSVVLFWDEIGAIFSVGDSWRAETREQLLQVTNGYHGGLRTGARPIPGGKACTSLLGTMTRAELEANLNPSQASDGLLGRILFSPDGERGAPISRGGRLPLDYEAKRARVVARIRELSAWLDEQPVRGVYDCLTPEAGTAWDAWYTTRVYVATGLEGGLLARGASIGIRLAYLLALAETGSDDIEPRHVEQAVCIVETSIRIALQAVETEAAALRDRWLDNVETKLTKGPLPLSRVLEVGCAPQPGERTPDNATKEQWLRAESRRFELTKSASKRGGSFVVTLTAPE